MIDILAVMEDVLKQIRELYEHFEPEQEATLDEMRQRYAR